MFICTSFVSAGEIENNESDFISLSNDNIDDGSINSDNLNNLDESNKLVDVGSSNSLLRASSNTLYADSELSSDNSTDSKIETVITADNIGGLPGARINVYATVVDINGNPVNQGTAMMSTDGQTYYSSLNNGLAIFYNVELPLENSVDEISFLEDDTYRGSSVFINITVDDNLDEGYAGGFTPDNSSESDVENTTDNNDTAVPDELTERSMSRLERNATANPIMMLILALIAVCGNGIYRNRK